MAYDNYRYGTGLSNVGSYQVSGKPFLSGGIAVTTNGRTKIKFPAVTSWIMVSSSGMVSIAMSDNGVGSDGASNYFSLNTADAAGIVPLNLKCTELYLSASAEVTVDVIAGLTGIDIERIDYPVAISPSGSNWSGSAGIG